MNRIIRLIVHDLAIHFHFDEEEAIQHLLESNETTIKEEKKPKEQKEQKEKKEQKEQKEKKRKIPEKKIPLPWLGCVDETKCQALQLNYGLYTQCFRDPMDEGMYCAKCHESRMSHGTVQDRQDPAFNGKGKKPTVMYGKVLKDRGISHEEAKAYAEKEGVCIPEEHFALKKPKKNAKPVHDYTMEIEEEIDDKFPCDGDKGGYVDSEDEDEYEEITCNVIEYKGVSYLLDRCTHSVYGRGENNPYVGKYKEEEERIEFVSCQESPP